MLNRLRNLKKKVNVLLALLIELIKTINEDLHFFNPLLISILKYLRIFLLFLEILDVSILEIISFAQVLFQEIPLIAQDHTEIVPLAQNPLENEQVVQTEVVGDQTQVSGNQTQVSVDQDEADVEDKMKKDFANEENKDN